VLNNKILKANGWTVGCAVGWTVGCAVGWTVGCAVGWTVGWTLEKRTVTEAGRDGHGEWSKTKDLLYDGKGDFRRIVKFNLLYKF
jgi:hypothetical protein